MWLGTKQLKIHCWRVRSLSGIPKEILSIQEIDIKFTTASNESTRDSSPKKVIQYLRIMVANPLSCQWLSMAPFCSLSAHLDTVWKGVKRCVDKGSNWSSWMLQLKKKLDPQNDMRLKFLWHWQLCWFIKVQQTCLKNDERLVAYFLIQNKLSLS